MEFRPGIFLRAICDAQWLVIDEINRAEIDKAVGELFTVLSGQRVDLSYEVGRDRVRIIPAKKTDGGEDWVPEEAMSDYDYIVHPAWRIVATMNVYDKSSLFAMSYAFMRRFTFVDVDVPGSDAYEELRERWLGDPKLGKASDRSISDLRDKLTDLLKSDTKLMIRRALGPAIAEDMIHYMADRSDQGAVDLLELLGEAFLLYAVPQLDGINRIGILEIYRYLKDFFPDGNAKTDILSRIRALYPHIQLHDWEKPPEQD